MTDQINQDCRQFLSRKSMLVALVVLSVLLAAPGASAQSARQLRGAPPVVPLTNEPPAKIIIDPPLAGPLSFGRVVIQYLTENLHVVPVPQSLHWTSTLMLLSTMSS